MTYIPGGGGGSSSIGTSDDVALNNPTDGQSLTYNAASSKWTNATVSSGGGDVAGHAAAVDPHAAAKYAIMPDGGRHIWTRTTAPSALDGAIEGDVWAGPES